MVRAFPVAATTSEKQFVSMNFASLLIEKSDYARLPPIFAGTVEGTRERSYTLPIDVCLSFHRRSESLNRRRRSTAPHPTTTLVEYQTVGKRFVGRSGSKPELRTVSHRSLVGANAKSSVPHAAKPLWPTVPQPNLGSPNSSNSLPKKNGRIQRNRFPRLEK